MLIAALLVVVVIYLANKAPDPTVPSGEPNGSSTSNMGLGTGVPGIDNALPYLGTTGTPSPLTGGGRGGTWNQNLQLLSVASPFAKQRWNGNGVSGGESYFPGVRSNTGVLNPLPNGYTTKSLQTENYQVLPGNQGLSTKPTGKI